MVTDVVLFPRQPPTIDLLTFAQIKMAQSELETRPRRENAGRNMGKLASQEEEGGDEFYSTAYGGFTEESEDEEYETEASEDDKVDSDFDVDETEWEPGEEAEAVLRKEEKMRPKQQWIKKTLPPSTTTPKADKPKKQHAEPPTDPAAASERRSFRKSTQEISRGFRKRQEEEEEMRLLRTVRRRTKRVKRQLTHEELLEEARWTAIENVASLEAYTRTMAEKKKVKPKKRIFSGPVVRYLSVVMPMVQECGVDTAAEAVEEGKEEGEDGCVSAMEVDSCKDSQEGAYLSQSEPVTTEMPTNDGGSGGNRNTDKSASQSPHKTAPTPSKPHPTQPKHSRNFMIFTDTNRFPSAYFPPRATKPTRPRRKLCPVTGLPAKYIDPLTHTPYATPFAFKVIRMRYVSEAEEKCEKRLVQLSNWLEEKKKKKMETT